jgi:lysophospholipase L1-like esterase
LEAGIANALKYAEVLVDSILAATSHAIVGIVPPLTPGRQDAFGLNYGCLIPRWRYRKNQHALAHAIRERFAARHERLDIVPAYLRIDPVSGYPERMEQVNGRAEGMKLTACNAVHPSESGHRQIADALLSWAAGRLS